MTEPMDVPPDAAQLLPVKSEKEIQAALAQPCVLSSDISTLMTVEDVIGE